MRLAILLALATVVTAVVDVENADVYQPGHEYVYQYEGHVLSGVPKMSSQFAGLKIDADVILQFLPNHNVIGKLERVQVFKIDSVLERSPNEPLTESDVTPLSGESSDVIKHLLAKPIKFTWSKGLIRGIQFEADDEYWSMNLKKGVIGLLQVSLRQQGSHRSFSRRHRYSSRRSPWRLRRPFDRHSFSDDITDPFNYLVMESDVMGECETKYMINSDSNTTSSGPKTILVTAIRNFDNCVKKPHYIEGIFAGVYTDNNEKDLIQPMIHTDYVITRHRDNFIIKDVKRHGKYFFTPRPTDNGDLSAYIHQTLKLTKTGETRQRVDIASTVIDPTGLELIIPQAALSSSNFMSSILESHDSSDEDRSRESSSVDVDGSAEETQQNRNATDNTELISTIEKKLQETIDCVYAGEIDKLCSLHIFQLVHVLKSASPADLKELIMSYTNTSQHDKTAYRKREMLLDTLATQPTPELAVVMLQLVQSRQVSELRASLMINAMSLVVKPTPAVILTALKVYKELDRSESIVRRSLLLGVGSLTNRLLMLTRSHKQPHHHVITLVETVSNELKTLFEETSDDEERKTILKSMGNLGSAELVPILKTVIEDRQMNEKIRVNAIYALRRVAKQSRKEVTPVLLNLVMDTSQPVDVRIGAFVILRNTVPNYVTLQAIVRRLYNERASQIRTFIYTSLVSMTKYRGAQPRLRRMANDAKLLLKTIPPVTVGVHDSFWVLFDFYSDETATGADLSLISLKSKMSGLPRALVANLQATLLGKHLHVAEVGVEGNGIETVLRRLVGPYGVFQDIVKGTISIKDILKPFNQPNSDEIHEKINEVGEKVMPKMRLDDEFMTSWYVHLLGHELQSMTITPDTVDTVTRQVKETLPTIVNKLIEGYKVDVLKTLSLVNSLVIPTPLGVPLTFNVSSVAIVKVDGQVQLHNFSSWSNLLRNRSLQDNIKLDVNIQPSVEMTSSSSLGVDMRWITAGSAYMISSAAQVPLKAETTLDIAHKELEFKIFSQNTDKKIFKCSVVPFTLIKYLPTSVSNLPFTLEVKEMVTDNFIKPINFQKTFWDKLSGTKYMVTGEYSDCGPDWCPTFPFYSKHELNVVSSPKTAAEFIVIKMKSSGFIGGELFNVDAVAERNDTKSTLINNSSQAGEAAESDHGTFDPVIPDPLLSGNPYHQDTTVTVSTSDKERWITCKISEMFDRQHWLKGHLNVQVIGNTGQRWKVTLNDVCNFIALSSSSSANSEEILHKMKLTWTTDNEEKYIKYKIVPGDKIVNINETLTRLGLESIGSTLSPEYKHIYTLDAEMSHMNRTAMKYIIAGSDLLKRYFYNYMTVGIPSQPIHNKLIIAAEFIPAWEKMTLVVESPREMDVIVDAPFHWNVFLPVQTMSTAHDQVVPRPTSNFTAAVNRDVVHYKSPPNFYRNETSRECLVTLQDATTFDGLTVAYTRAQYTALSSGCKLLITQDCSDALLFAILASAGKSWRKLQVLVPGQEIEYVWKGALVITVNGQEKNVEPSHPVIIYEESGNVSSSSNQTLYKIEKIDDGEHIVLECYKLGVTIIVNYVKYTTKIKLSASSVLQGQLCGLCGNYNQQVDDEFERSVIVPSDTCNFTSSAQRDKPQTHSEHDRCMVKQPLTISRRHDGQALICQSDYPVQTCSSSCRPASWTTIDVCFQCHAQSSSTDSPPTTTTERSSVRSYKQRIDVPTACTAA